MNKCQNIFFLVSGIISVSAFSSCSPATGFTRSETFLSQQDHVDGDLPADTGGTSPTDPAPGAPKTPPVVTTPPKLPPVVVSPPKLPPVILTTNDMPKPTPPPKTSEPTKTPGKSCDRDKDITEISETYRCGAKMKKVLVCHVPPGNPANAHTICISLNGAENGHGVPIDGSVGRISGDKLGACSPGDKAYEEPASE